MVFIEERSIPYLGAKTVDALPYSVNFFYGCKIYFLLSVSCICVWPRASCFSSRKRLIAFEACHKKFCLQNNVCFLSYGLWLASLFTDFMEAFSCLGIRQVTGEVYYSYMESRMELIYSGFLTRNLSQVDRQGF